MRRRSRGTPISCKVAAHGGRLHESDVAAGRAVAPRRGRGAEPPRLTAWFVSGLLALLALHVAEPDLPLSWGFAGLRAVWGTVVPGLVAFVVVLAAVALAWRSPIASRPVPRVRPAAVVAGALVVWLVLALAGLRWPAPDVCPDAMFLPHQLRTGGAGNVRWLLSVPLLQLLYAPFHGHVDADLVLRVVNAMFSTLSMLLTLAVAMRLGRSVREVAAVVLLVWTGLGSLQLALGYVDIYPLVQLLVALYVWSALRYLDGDGGIVWPLLVAVAGPCFYIGLILLAPSVLVLLAVAVQRRDSRRSRSPRARPAHRRARDGAGLSVHRSRCRPGSSVSPTSDYGLNPGRQTLPLAYMLSLRHAGEVLSTLLLLDGTALVLLPPSRCAREPVSFCACCWPRGSPSWSRWTRSWGPYSDWDLFSYLTLPLGVAAGSPS